MFVYLLAQGGVVVESGFEDQVLGIVLLAVVAGALIGVLYQEVRWSRKNTKTVDKKLDEIKEKTVAETRSHVTATLRTELEGDVRKDLESRIRGAAEEDAKLSARKIVSEAEEKKEKIIANAQKKAEEQTSKMRKDVEKSEKRVEQREIEIKKSRRELKDLQEALDKRDKQVKDKERNLDKELSKVAEKRTEIMGRLEALSSYTANEAKEELLREVAEDTKVEAAKVSRQIEEEAIEIADRQAKKIISVAVQRWAGEYVAERCVAVVSIPSDELKGRIIGREGRNIRAIEAATGTDLIIDDTPEAVMVSSFDPVRREVARLVLEKLVSDGRIHPSRIEEITNKTQKEVEKEIKDRGERAAFELGLGGLHADLINLLGRLRYRTSYGQNQWAHSIEVGFLCGLMAAELGVNVKTARRAGLLHDIGKALTHEREGSHAVIGAEIAARCGESEIVRNAIAAHHNDEPQNSVYAHLVIAADALSGARPGARREILETYVQRLRDLEKIATEFDGVERSFAIQAGREIRVMVENAKVNDDQAFLLSKEIARKIEDELTYPGQIKVCVIRETRAVDYAK